MFYCCLFRSDESDKSDESDELDELDESDKSDESLTCKPDYPIIVQR